MKSASNESSSDIFENQSMRLSKLSLQEPLASALGVYANQVNRTFYAPSCSGFDVMCFGTSSDGGKNRL